MKIFITYGDGLFESKKRLALKCASLLGGFDKCIGYSSGEISTSFYNQNRTILESKIGGGYWLWKPYFILKTLREADGGDYVFYSDAGAFLTGSISHLIKVMHQANQDMMGFETPLIEKQWTKREVFEALNCTHSSYEDSNQIMASFILIKKTEQSVSFLETFLRVATNPLHLTDSYSNTKQDNNFIQHRHDQSIFSLLYKKSGYKPFKDPSQFGLFPRNYAGYAVSSNLTHGDLHELSNGRKFRINKYFDQYPPLIFHYRSRNPFISYAKHIFGKLLFRLGLYDGLF